MENQKNGNANPLLSNTSRQFYSRRIAQRPNSNVQLDKILKILTQQNEKRPYSRVKTQQKEDCKNVVQMEIDNMLKMSRIKLQNVMKRQRIEWKELYELFDQFKRSSSIDVMKMNQANFIQKMEEVIKMTIKHDQTSTQRNRTKDGLSKRKDGRISLENIKLCKENQILKEQLDNYQSKEKKVETTRSIQFPKEEVKDQCMRKIPQEEYAEMLRETDYLKQTNCILKDQKKALLEKINELKATNENLCEEILKSRDNSNSYMHKFQTWRNIMSMQHEEIISLKRDIQDIKKQFGDLHRKYQNTLKRISKLSNTSQSKLSEITAKSVDIFTEQIQSFQRIRNAFVAKGFYSVIGGQRDAKDNGTVLYKKYLGDKDTLNNSDGIKRVGKDYYRCYKPSFFIYLEKYFEYQGVDRENFEQVSIAVGMQFLTTLRGILDSKHNEYLLSRNISKKFTSLSCFTLSWLSNYRIDPKTRKQEEINTDVCFETIGSFYARLMNSQLNGNWEVITFREFLLETLTTDELAFYLKARFKLLKGDCLVGAGAFLQVYYINYLDALLLIQEIVGDFQYRKKLEEYIKRSVEFQRKKQLIDAHFILRLLLQYYQYHKSKLFSTLCKTFTNFTKDKNSSMPFESYLKIYDYNFSEVSLIEKVEIYQKAFSLGRGVVNLENIFTVLNEEGYLFGQVQKMFSKHVIYQQTESAIMGTQAKCPEQIEQFQTYYQSICESALGKGLVCLGLQRIKRQASLLRVGKTLSYETIIQRFQLLHKLSILTLKKMFHTKRIKQPEFNTLVPFLLKFHKEFGKATIERNDVLSIIEDFKKKSAARAIFKFYRKKKGIYARSYLLASQNMDKTSKIDEIRKEFTSIIDNIKKKYNAKAVNQTINQYDQIE